MTGERRGALGLLLALGVLAAGLGAWWLMRESGAAEAARDAAVLTAARLAGDAPAPALPAADTRPAAAEALVATTPDPTAEVLAAAVAAAAAAAALPGAEALFTGRVVDERGAPVADALVAHVPAYKVRKALGLIGDSMTGAVLLDKLAQVRTAADGSFSIASRDLPVTAGREIHRDNGMSYIQGTQPELLVRHPDFEVLVHFCRSFRSGPCDVGTLVLAPCGTLVGRIVDGTGAPVAGARLSVDDLVGAPEDRGGDFALLRQALAGDSGSDGRFALPGFGNDRVALQIVHPDFVPGNVSATAQVGTRTDLGDVALARGDSIAGVVLDNGGRPVAGALVLARAASFAVGRGADSILMEVHIKVRSRGVHEVRTRTDAHGEFTLGTLNQKRYAVFVDAEGWEPACERDVAAGRSDLALRLQPQGTLLLTVVDATSEAPVDGARGTAVRCSDNEQAGNDGMDAKLDVLAGSEAVQAAALAAAPGLPASTAAGAGVLLVQRAGLLRTEVTVSAPGHETRGFVLPGVQPGEQLQRTLKLKREALLAGLVLQDGVRTPIADATVSLAPPKDSRVKLGERTTTTGADGAFRFGELHNGEWSLTVSAPGFLDSEARPLDVKSELPREGLEVLLKRGARLIVLLLGADGAPATGQEVVVRCTDRSLGKDPWKAITDGTGRALFAALPPGAMDVSAFPGGEAHATLTAEQPTELTLALRRQPVLRGRVTAGGVPLAGARVTATERTEIPGLGSITSDDLTATASALGEYELLLRAPATLLLLAHDAAGPDAACSRPALVSVGWDEVQRADLTFGGARVTGVVLDAATQQPVAGASLRLRAEVHEGDPALKPWLGDLSPFVRSGADGRFLFERALPGSFALTASAKGYGDVVLDALVAKDGETLEVPHVALSRGTTLKGVLRTADGKPLPPGLRVTATPVDQPTGERSTSAADDGSWLIGGTLAAGTWTLSVVRQKVFLLGGDTPNPPLATRQVTVAAGETRVVDLVVDG